MSKNKPIKAYIFIGMPCSGKSTYIRETGLKHISIDQIKEKRNMKYNFKRKNRKKEEVKPGSIMQKIFEQVTQSIQNEEDFAYEALNIEKEKRAYFIEKTKEIAKSLNKEIEFIAVFMDTDPDTAYLRGFAREKDSQENPDQYTGVNSDSVEYKNLVNYCKNLDKPRKEEGFSQIIVIKSS